MRLLLPFAFAAVALTSACNVDSTGPNGSIVGTYSLRTINGSPLPYQVAYNLTITSEQLTLGNDGSYSDVAYYSNGTSYQEVGYYSANNNAITFNDQTDGITYQGSVSGDVLTEINSGYTATYRKD